LSSSEKLDNKKRTPRKKFHLPFISLFIIGRYNIPYAHLLSSNVYCIPGPYNVNFGVMNVCKSKKGSFSFSFRLFLSLIEVRLGKMGETGGWRNLMIIHFVFASGLCGFHSNVNCRLLELITAIDACLASSRD
jgi:hypothetical protein